MDGTFALFISRARKKRNEDVEKSDEIKLNRIGLEKGSSLLNAGVQRHAKLESSLLLVCAEMEGNPSN